MRIPHVLIITTLLACAHGRGASPAEHRHATYCQVSIRQAEASLVRSGWPITARGDAYVQTGYAGDRETFVLVASGIHRYRYSVVAEGGGVRWQPFRQTSTSMGPFAPDKDSGERRWDTELWKKDLLTFRRHVCGGE